MLRNFKESGSLFNITQLHLFTENIYELALSDLLMATSIMLSLPLQKVYAASNGWLRWSRGGMVVQSLFQGVWLTYWVGWPFVRTWTWTAQVFFTLHLLALLFKMHSYAFYNGHLSETKRRLDELDKPAGKSRAAAKRYPNPYKRLSQVQAEAKKEAKTERNAEDLSKLREDLAKELTSPLGHVTYPHNLTVFNFIDFLFCPTLCYELEYPRTKERRYMELFWKGLAVFGCIFLLTLISEEFIIPVLADSAIQLKTLENMNAHPKLTDQLLILAETTSRLLFPFMLTFLLVFLVVFEYLLGAFAEITCFADRHFYADWWNSCDWLEFSREWNIPVHHFFRRHVYSASTSYIGRPGATVVTFLVSALAHELVMGCITKKLRGYGFVAMMLQMPLVMGQRTRFMRGKKLLNVSLLC
jgi:sterol O-acyltransferase